MKLDFYTHVALHKNNILVKGYKNGKRVAEKVAYKPYLFVPSKTETQYQTIHGKPVGRVDFDSVWEARKFIRDYKDVDGMTIYGMQNFVYTYIFDNFPGELKYDEQLINVVGIDIEVDARGKFASPDTAENEVTLITLNNRGSTMTFGCKPFDASVLQDATYIQCLDERDLLIRFLDCWNGGKYAPDVVTGYNINVYDIPYLYNRICRILGEDYANKLSPWGIIDSKTFTNPFGKEQTTYNLVGIVSLDYIELYKKFAFTPQESYGLDHVCFMELGERKTDYGEYGSLAGLQEGNWDLYCRYNVRDTQLVYMLDEKLKLIDLVFAIGYEGKFNFEDAFGTVRAWDVIIHHYLLEQNIVIPPHNYNNTSRNIIGGYVKDPHVGMHDWVVSFDVTSLYPHIIMGYNISPEMYAGRNPNFYSMEQLLSSDFDNEDLKTRDVSLTANGLNFKRDKEGFIPALSRKFFESRDNYKNLKRETEFEIEEIEVELSERGLL